MSDHIQLRWETVTKWMFRLGIFIMSIVFTFGGNAALAIFSEVRADVKLLLHGHATLEGRVNAVEARTSKVENEIDKIRDSKSK